MRVAGTVVCMSAAPLVRMANSLATESDCEDFGDSFAHVRWAFSLGESAWIFPELDQI